MPESNTPQEDLQLDVCHDRVADAYLGKLGEQFMRETQERIHWVCSSVQGKRVLDVGCSQGIAPILLAREGHRVMGLDCSQQAIETAKALSDSELESVRQSLHWETGNFLNWRFENCQFDTIIMAEVLEHQIRPKAFIERAAELLPEDGTLIVTVPFGINDDPDHKQTFYLLEPYKLMCSHFQISEVAIQGRWICLVGKRKEAFQPPDTFVLEESYSRLLENAFFDLNRQLVDQVKTVRNSLDNANSKYRISTENINKQKKSIQDLQNRASEATTQMRKVEAELDRKQVKLDAQASELELRQGEAVELRSQLEAAKQDLTRFLEEKAGEKAAFDALIEEKKRELSQQEGQVGELVAEKDGLVSALAQKEKAISDLEKHQGRLLEARTALSAEKEGLLREVGTLRKKMQASDVEQSRLNVELQSRSDKLKEAKTKLIEVRDQAQAAEALHTEEVKRLEERLAQTRLDLDANEKALESQTQALGFECERSQELASTSEELSRELQLKKKALEENEKALFGLKTEMKKQLAEREAETQELMMGLEKAEESRYLRETELFEQVEVLQRDLTAERASADRSNDEITCLQEKNATLSHDMDMLSQDLKNALDQKAEISSAFEEERAILGTVRNEKAGLEEALALKEERNRALHDEKVYSDSRFDLLEANLKTDQNACERVQADLVRERKRTRDLNADLQSLKAEIAHTRELVARTKATLSFSLGHTLIFGFKSFGGFYRLPWSLWKIRREARRRKKLRKAKNPAGSKRFAFQKKNKRIQVKRKQAASGVLDIAHLKSLKVAAIMDEFTFNAFCHECNLLQLTPQNWKEELEGFAPDFLFIESAWRGKDELWGNKVGHLATEVQEILGWCKKQNIPTTFWNKEDPIHFETFLNTAHRFDYVFTTDMDCIHRYKAALGHEHVYLLPFAAQPEIHNPIETYARKDAFCFAGAYYVRYPERTRDLGNFASELTEFKPLEIYDRNYGKDDQNYQFPDEYQPYIVGTLPFSEIDKAYKGYRYAINLNSIKQSQTMFARRVYELLASNTLTVSNFSKGVRLLFGDLVVTSDSGAQLTRRIRDIERSEESFAKFRLAGLRKVMNGHTYEDRFAYMVSKVQGTHLPSLLPEIAVTAYAKNREQLENVLRHFQNQAYENKTLHIVVPGGGQEECGNVPENVTIWEAPAIEDSHIEDLLPDADWLAGFVPDDHYGPNYLLDLALATRYRSEAYAIGKRSHYVLSPASGLQAAYSGEQYRDVETLPARSALIRKNRIADFSFREWAVSLYTLELKEFREKGGILFSVDAFNYCKNGGGGLEDKDRARVEDVGLWNEGVSAAELIGLSENIAPAEQDMSGVPSLGHADIASWLPESKNPDVSFVSSSNGLTVNSTLPDGKHDYFYLTKDFKPGDLHFQETAHFFLDTGTGLNLQLVVLFLDKDKQKLGHVVKMAGKNHEVDIPAKTAWVRLGLRVYASGTGALHQLVLGHRPLQPAGLVARAEQLILTNHYPSNSDIYRNGFVHSRVKAYRERGVLVDVFRLRTDEALSFHEFEGVDVTTGSQEALDTLLSTGNYQNVLVHFLDEAMWEVLKHHIDRIKVIVWVHGAEIQPWHRRAYNYNTDQELEKAKAISKTRTAFWRGVLNPIPENLQLVFVSQYFADEVMEDLGIKLPKAHYRIIHNPIDTKLFAYTQKKPEDRKSILSIRPYASATYANDLSVKAILELSNKSYFNELDFRMVGDGPLFDTTLAPLREFENITIEKKFVSQEEIAKLHRSYGIFLSPSRMDTQGVSRDEAMASGLIPITNAVGAIPEFVDQECGIMVKSEDYRGIADGIGMLYENPEIFLKMSKAAAGRVRIQSGAEKMIELELEVIRG
ncbi:methyltransferase domain-containing protein [Desulfoluna spongiiphila]|uniref:methyltransferase domain-containing protein n=1 Tax=Desulfoluna spongiiphila TaxID=419481 RepID=UPI0012572808|nr:glycosyltransferase [Desulfoluna spongiiphila]VVS92359.1 glycosyl transferases group 1 [Desulfoluna spongiiphila]